MNNLTAVDLFSGAGGLSAGLLDSGIDVCAGFDNSEVALKIYERNVAKHTKILNLQDEKRVIGLIADFSPDLIVGGPPCQDFSTAGKRTEGVNANLTEKFGNIVVGCRTNFFLMENVTQVRNSRAYGNMRSKMLNIGYQLSEMVINSVYFGVPQIRKRFFVFGWRGSKNFGSKLESWLDEKIEQRPMTVKEYLGPKIDIDYYYRHPRNYSRRSVFSVTEPSPTIRGINRPVPPEYKGNHLDAVSPSTVRQLSFFERSQIQTFPRSWCWDVANSKTAIELNIGNAVPVKLASIIGEGINFAVS